MKYNGLELISLEMCKYCKLERISDSSGNLFDVFNCKLGIKENDCIIDRVNPLITLRQCPSDSGLEGDEDIKSCMKLEVLSDEKISCRSSL